MLISLFRKAFLTFLSFEKWSNTTILFSGEIELFWNHLKWKEVTLELFVRIDHRILIARISVV